MNKVIVVKCRPFAGQPRKATKCVVEGDVVRVYDAREGCYTTYHSLSARDERRIREKANGAA